MSIKLPNDWHFLELKELIEKKRSIRYGIVQPGEYDENGRYMVRGQDYSFGWVEPENLFKVSDVIESKYKNARLKTGDIILTIVGAGTGTVAIVPEWLDGANCTQTTARIAIEPSKADSLFCYYYLSSDKGKKLTYQNIKGGAQPGLNCGDIEYFGIILPPLPEQKAIAQLLSIADAAIHTTEKLIAQKVLRKKWLMQQLLSGKKRLKGFGGEWKKERLEKYLVKHDEKSTINNQYPVLTSSRRGIFFQSDYYTRDVASEDNTGYNVVPRGYFTYRHMSDDLIFKFNINDIVDRGIVSTLYPVFTTKDINSYFLLVKLNEGSEFKMHAEEQKQGGSRTYVYFKTLCQLKLNLPSYEEQIAIAQVLQAADKEISLLKAKAEKLREQKKGLMQQLLTGKVRLKIKE